MAISADFPMLSFAEANPYLTGLNLGRESMQKSLAFPSDLLAKVLENQMNAAKAKYAEPTAAQELEKLKLGNALSQKDIDWYDPKVRSLLALQGAQTGHMGALTNQINTLLPQELLAKKLANRESQFNLDNPLLKGTATKDLGALLADPRTRDAALRYLSSGGSIPLNDSNSISTGNQPGQSPLPGQSIQQSQPQSAQYPGQSSNTGQNQSDLVSSLLAQNSFNKLTPAEKNARVKQFVAMGYDITTAQQLARSGKDPDQAAQTLGWENAVTAPQPLSPAEENRRRAANAAAEGVAAISPYVVKGNSHYIGGIAFRGVPLGFYIDSLTGKNKDKQSDFIAASVLGTDENLMRAKQAGAPISVALFKHSAKASLTDKNAPWVGVTPEVMKEAERKINEGLDKVKDAEARGASKSPYPEPPARQKSSKSNIDENKIRATAMKYQKVWGYDNIDDAIRHVRTVLEQHGRL